MFVRDSRIYQFASSIYLILCNPHEKQGKQNLRILFTFSRVCGPPFDDPKGRWRRGGGINVPIILKFSTRRAEALNVKELVRQTGIVYKWGLCY